MVEGKALERLTQAMRIKDKLENYGTVDAVLEDFLASLPEDYLERKAEAKGMFKDLQEKVLRDEVLERGVRSTAEVRRDPADLGRDERAPPRAWSAVFDPRRDPGPGHRHARHG